MRYHIRLVHFEQLASISKEMDERQSLLSSYDSSMSYASTTNDSVITVIFKEERENNSSNTGSLFDSQNDECAGSFSNFLYLMCIVFVAVMFYILIFTQHTEPDFVPKNFTNKIYLNYFVLYFDPPKTVSGF